MNRESWQALADFVKGKTVKGIRSDEKDDGFDLLFTDGSELEIYCFSNSRDSLKGFGWAFHQEQNNAEKTSAA